MGSSDPHRAGRGPRALLRKDVSAGSTLVLWFWEDPVEDPTPVVPRPASASLNPESDRGGVATDPFELKREV